MVDSIKLINDFEKSTQIQGYIKKHIAEIHSENLETIFEHYYSIFGAFDEKEVAKAVLLEYAIYHLEKGL